jgi:eukaryotic-like serine/threonine-protein kinase
LSAPREIAGRYNIERRLGAGGMSTVFLARDSVLERPVAVKLLAEHLSDDEAFVARFRREALAAARLQHPNIVQVFDSGEDEESGRHFIVMEYVNGPSCADLLRESPQLDIDKTVEIVRGACHGLDYAHRAGVVHRDVKPGNLLLAEDTGSVKLADFGIAKAAEQTRITQVGAVLGTAAYLSPEQATGEEAGPASDIYSLGVCAYQFLAGRLPYEYSSLTELALKQQSDTVEPITNFRQEVPRALDMAIRRCLERDPALRYSSALEMATALDAGLHGDEAATAAYNTASTQIFTADDEDATQAMPRTTALPRQQEAWAPAPAEPIPPRERRPAERQRKKRDGAARARLFALLLILVLAGVAVALLVSSSSGGGFTDINAGNAHDQADQLIQYVRDHRK